MGRLVRRINEAGGGCGVGGAGGAEAGEVEWPCMRGEYTRLAMIGVWGAAFDFHAGNVKWAPAWMRKVRAGMGVSADARAEADVEEESGLARCS